MWAKSLSEEGSLTWRSSKVNKKLHMEMNGSRNRIWKFNSSKWNQIEEAKKSTSNAIPKLNKENITFNLDKISHCLVERMVNCRNWTCVLVMAIGGGGYYYQIRCLFHANSKKLPFAAFYETRVQDSTFPFPFRCSDGWLYYFSNGKLFTFPRPYFLSLLVSGCRFKSTNTRRKMN